MLVPLRTQIEEFRKKVEEAQTDSKTGVTKLETLIGTLGGLNQQLSEEAQEPDHCPARILQGARRLGRTDRAQSA